MIRRATLSCCLALVPSIALAAAPSVMGAIAALRSAAPGEVELVRSDLTGSVTYFAAAPGPGVPVPDANATEPAERALSFLSTYGEAFGVRSAADLELKRAVRDELLMDHVRYQQLHRGVPVTGGELIVHLQGDRVQAANGKTVSGLEEISVDPAIGSAEALAAVSQVLLKHMQIDDAELSEPRLELFNRGLLEERATSTRLAWFIQASRVDLLEYFWVDASTGTVMLHFSQLAEAKNRKIYNGNNGSSLPGTLMRSEGGPATGDADADNAYLFAGSTYDYFLTQHGRDSYDGAGAQLKSTVHHCPSPSSCPMQNAFWNGVQMVYGDGFSAADDVVAHELTHAVTEYTANLLYYMQSGALNESFSDIFGETVDLTNGLGNDATGVRWLLGEDIAGGAIRNMMNPPAFGHPSRTGDAANFRCFENGADNGGVHYNSGVPNHGYALMVDGGSFNGRTVTGIGLTKAGKIQYRALANYLVSASNFADTYNALNRSCVDLIGVAGITAADCAQVKNALDAVELAGPLPCSPPHAAAPPLCPVGQSAVNWSFINFESSIGIPVCPPGAAPTGWCDYDATGVFGGPYATSGVHSLWGYDRPTAGVLSREFVWAGALPTNAKLQFHHGYSFESDAGDFYDGGVLEYSINGGATWLDAAPLFAAGATYQGEIIAGANPLDGRNGFVGESWGYTATQLNIAALAGQAIRIRFRIGTDSSVDDRGWFIDDLRIYQCAAATTSETIGLYDRSPSRFLLRNQNSSGAANYNFVFGPGNLNWVPISGDWDGDGDDTTGLFNPTLGRFYLRNQHAGGAADYNFVFGPSNTAWVPIAGDWDGDGDDTVGLYNRAAGRFYIRNQHAGGAADATFQFGPANTTWVPIAGDWNGDGTDTIGLYDPGTGRFYLRNQLAGGAADATFLFGPSASSWLPIAGDWNGDGIDTIGLYNRAASRYYLRNQHSGGTADLNFTFGLPNSTLFPLAGNWDGL